MSDREADRDDALEDRAVRRAALGILDGYARDPRGHLIGRKFLPSRDETREVLQLLLQLFFPGYFGRQDLTEANVSQHVE